MRSFFVDLLESVRWYAFCILFALSLVLLGYVFRQVSFNGISWPLLGGTMVAGAVVALEAALVKPIIQKHLKVLLARYMNSLSEEKRPATVHND